MIFEIIEILIYHFNSNQLSCLLVRKLKFNNIFINNTENTDPVSRMQVITVGQTALRCQAAILPINAFIVMTNMMLQSMGKGIKASITASARNGLFFIPAILILPIFFDLTGVEITQTVADVLTLLMSIPFAVQELRKLK